MVYEILIRAFAVTVAGVVAGGGCSDDTATSEPPSQAEELNVLLGRSDPEVTKRVLETQVSNAQKSMVTCMADRGFDFVAMPVDAIMTLGPAATMPREEFAERYGLGHLPLAGPNAPAPALINEDPNEEVLAGMSATERDSWYTSADDCQVVAEQQTAILGMTQSGMDVIEAFEERVATDQRVVDAAAGWSTCMAEQGVLFSSPDAMEEHFQRVSQELIEAGAWDGASPRHAEYEEGIRLEKQAATANLRCEPDFRSVEDEVIAEFRPELLNDLQAASD